MKKARFRISAGLRTLFRATLLGAAVFGVGAAHAAAGEEGVEVGIRFFDRRIYYVSGDPILIQVTIANNGPATYRFKLADDRRFSVDFEVRTVMNVPLERSEELIRRRTQSTQVFFREIAVEPGESLSFVENLRDFVRLDEPGSFVVRAFVHPDLYRSDFARTAAVGQERWFAPPERRPAGRLESPRLGLDVRPPSVIGPDGLPTAMYVATGAVLAREAIPPDEVVERTIMARQRSQWERFFLYLDLEQMLIRGDPARERVWRRESAEGRRRMVELFRQELKSPTTVEGISLVPSYFAIERTQHTGHEGTVTVLKRFRGPHVTEIKRYTYFLRRRDNVWSIVDLSVVNLGTE